MSVIITNANNKFGIELGDEVVMPEPAMGDDAWTFGNFVGTVDRIRNISGVEMATVIDADGDGWDIELDRLERP